MLCHSQCLAQREHDPYPHGSSSLKKCCMPFLLSGMLDTKNSSHYRYHYHPQHHLVSQPAAANNNPTKPISCAFLLLLPKSVKSFIVCSRPTFLQGDKRSEEALCPTKLPSAIQENVPDHLFCMPFLVSGMLTPQNLSSYHVLLALLFFHRRSCLQPVAVTRASQTVCLCICVQTTLPRQCPQSFQGETSRRPGRQWTFGVRLGRNPHRSPRYLPLAAGV